MHAETCKSASLQASFFAAGEQVRTLLLYALHPPRTDATSGRLSDKRYDAQAHLLRVALSPGTDGYAEVRFSNNAPSKNSQP